VTWLLKLYPPRWRRRYEAEFRALIASQPFSFFTALDIVGGAIDAWTRPQSHLATPNQSEGDTIMLAKMMRCLNAGAKATVADGVKGAAVIIGGELLYVFVAAWMRRHSVDPRFTRAVMSNGWLFGFVLAMPFWLLKGWPARAQVVFVGAVLMVATSVVLIKIH
jgi:hypothetical protein